jgi:hypothetical protein
VPDRVLVALAFAMLALVCGLALQPAGQASAEESNDRCRNYDYSYGHGGDSYGGDFACDDKDKKDDKKCEDYGAMNYGQHGDCKFKKCEDMHAMNFGQHGDCKFKKCEDLHAMNFGQHGDCKFKKCEHPQAINFGEHGDCKFKFCEHPQAANFGHMGECKFITCDHPDAVNFGHVGTCVFAPKPQVIVVQPQVVQPVVVQTQPVVVQPQVIVQEVKQDPPRPQAVLGTSMVRPPSTGDGGLLADESGSALRSSVAGLALGPLGLLLIYGVYRARRLGRE